jgi:hypothetical protein
MAIARDESDAEIFNALTVTARQKPSNTLEAVAPYVYLVALSLKETALF